MCFWKFFLHIQTTPANSCVCLVDQLKNQSVLFECPLDPSATPPRRLLDASSTPPRRHLDASSTPPRRLLDARSTPIDAPLDAPLDVPSRPLDTHSTRPPGLIRACRVAEATAGGDARLGVLAESGRLSLYEAKRWCRKRPFRKCFSEPARNMLSSESIFWTSRK